MRQFWWCCSPSCGQCTTNWWTVHCAPTFALFECKTWPQSELAPGQSKHTGVCPKSLSLYIKTYWQKRIFMAWVHHVTLRWPFSGSLVQSCTRVINNRLIRHDSEVSEPVRCVWWLPMFLSLTDNAQITKMAWPEVNGPKVTCLWCPKENVLLEYPLWLLS